MLVTQWLSLKEKKVNTNKKPQLITLLILTAFASVAAVLYTPALPAIMHYFSINASQAQLTMSLFLVAYAIGPILYGPLSHRYGRKPTLYVGMLIGLVGVTCCILAYLTCGFGWLLLGRFIEGFGTSVGLVIAFTMVNDVYAGSEARRVLSLTTLAFAFLPALGIYIGGLLVQSFSWVSNFYFAFTYVFSVLLLCLLLPETRPEGHVEEIKVKGILQHYQRAFSDKNLWAYALMWALTTAFMYLFATFAPLVVIKQLKFSPSQYGLINGLSYLFLIVGNTISAKTTKHITARTGILLGVMLSTLGCLLLFAFALTNNINIISLYGSLCLAFMGLPFILANASALATAHIAPEHKAYASASISMINMGTAVIALFIVSHLNMPPLKGMSLIFLVLMGLEFVLLWLTRNKMIKASPQNN